MAMIKLGQEITAQSPVDNKVGKFIAEGVVNKSGAIKREAMGDLLAGGLKLGEQVVKQSVLQDTTDAQAAVNSQYAETSPTVFQDRLSALGEEKAAAVEGGKDVSPVMGKIQALHDRFMLAQKQGVMSEREFISNTTRVAREAINNNPYFTQDIIRQLQLVHEYSGVGSAISTDNEMAKVKKNAADAYLIDQRNLADTLGVPYDSTTPIPVLEEKNNAAKADNQSFQMFTRSKERQAYATAKEADTWAATEGFKVVRGATANFSNVLLKASAEVEKNPAIYPKFLADLTVNANLAKENFYATIAPQHRNIESVKTRVASFNAAIDGYVEAAKTVGSGAGLKTAMQNQYATTEAMQSTAVAEQVNVQQMKLLGDTLKFAPAALIENPSVRKKYTETIVDMVNMGTIKDSALPKDVNDKVTAGHLTAAVGYANANAGDFTVLNRTLKAFNTKSPTITSPETRLLFTHNNLTAIAKESPDKFKGVDADSVGQVGTMIQGQFADPVFGMGSLKNEIMTYKPQMSFTANGEIIFSGNKSEAFNAKHGIKINTALRAYANMNGKSTSEVKDQFYAQFIHPYLGVKK